MNLLRIGCFHNDKQMLKKVEKVTGYLGSRGLSEEQKTEEIFEAYQGAQDEWKMEADKNEKFAMGSQWTKKQVNILKSRGQAAVSINAITWAIEQLKALLTANKPRFQAVAREDSDTKKAAVISILLEYMWDISDGNSELKNAIDDYAKLGRGVMFAYIDPYASSQTGEVRFMSIDARDVYPDPASKDYLWRDAAHVVVATYKTEEQIVEEYPDFDMKGVISYESSRTNDSDRMSLEGQTFGNEKKTHINSVYRILERYTKKMVKRTHVIDPFSNEEYELSDDDIKGFRKRDVVLVNGQIMTEDSDVKRIMALLEGDDVEQLDETTYLYKPPPPDPQTQQGQGQGQQQQESVIIRTMKMSKLIAEGAVQLREITAKRIWRIITIGQKKYWSGYTTSADYPLVPINNHWNRNPYPISDVNMVRPVQELINKLNSLIIANAASSTNQKVLLPRGSQDKQRLEADLNKAGSTVIEFDAEIGQPVIFGATAFPNALFNQIDMYLSMIERQFGIYALMDGDASNAPQTFKGTMALDEFGQRRVKSKKDDIETSLNQLGKVMLDYARSTYTEEKIIRVVSYNGEVTETELNTVQYDDLNRAIGKFNDINTGRYDVRVVSGSTLPSNRYALMEYYMDLYERGLIDQVEVLKKAEVIDIEGVLERSGYIQQLEQKLQQLDEELKKVKGDLQTSSREEIHAKKRLEVEKFKSDLNSIKDSAQSTADVLTVQNKMAVQQQQPIQRGDE